MVISVITDNLEAFQNKFVFYRWINDKVVIVFVNYFSWSVGGQKYTVKVYLDM